MAKHHENSAGETSEWYTPKFIFDALRLEFDLDPAHPGIGAAHCCVPAKRIYTRQDDGLAQPLVGLVFMNPPFGPRRGQVPWMRKFFAHGNGVLIVRAYTSSDGSTPAKMLSHNCVICGKGLTDPASMARWIGPECAGTSSLRVPFVLDPFKRAAAEEPAAT